MLVPAREKALRALHQKVVGAFEGPVLRNGYATEDVPPGGLAIIHDGEVIEEVPAMGTAVGISWLVTHRAYVEAYVRAENATAVADKMARVQKQIGDMILGDPTLGGAVDYAVAMTPETGELDEDVTLFILASRIPVDLHFMAPGHLSG